MYTSPTIIRNVASVGPRLPAHAHSQHGAFSLKSSKPASCTTRTCSSMCGALAASCALQGKGWPVCQKRKSFSTARPVRSSRRSGSLLSEDEPGYSTYASNSLEAFWRKTDRLSRKPESMRTIPEVLCALSAVLKAVHVEKEVELLHHHPEGSRLLVPSLLRGAGLVASKGSLHEKGFRRLTMEKMQKRQRPGSCSTRIHVSPAALGRRMGFLESLARVRPCSCGAPLQPGRIRKLGRHQGQGGKQARHASGRRVVSAALRGTTRWVAPCSTIEEVFQI